MDRAGIVKISFSPQVTDLALLAENRLVFVTLAFEMREEKSLHGASLVYKGSFERRTFLGAAGGDLATCSPLIKVLQVAVIAVISVWVVIVTNELMV